MHVLHLIAPQLLLLATASMQFAGHLDVVGQPWHPSLFHRWGVHQCHVKCQAQQTVPADVQDQSMSRVMLSRDVFRDDSARVHPMTIL